jgi:hypothetical protein
MAALGLARASASLPTSLATGAMREWAVRAGDRESKYGEPEGALGLGHINSISRVPYDFGGEARKLS